jgi:hypothetical protein
MRVLFVTPSEVSAGEAITAHHMAADVVACGGEVAFLASKLTAGFLGDGFAGRVTVLGPDLATNRDSWAAKIRDFAPDAIVFADYPLLFFPSGTVPLADDAWVAALDHVDAALVTLDHLGYAQRPMTIDFGPAHLSLATAMTPTLPSRMQVALPCPVQEPAAVEGRVGRPFRYWSPPTDWSPDRAASVRRRYLDDPRDVLVLHSVPGWARRAAALWELPYFRFLPRLLAEYLSGLGRRVTVVAVNDGSLLPPSGAADVAIVNLGALPAAEFEDLLLAADLVLTENSVSVGLGKAVCAGRPAAVLRNSKRLVELIETADPPIRDIVLAMEGERLGAVFRYEVFPIWSAADLDRLGIHRGNRFADGFAKLEAFGGEATRAAICDLLRDERRDGPRAERDRQRVYAESVAALPGPDDVLRAMTAAG